MTNPTSGKTSETIEKVGSIDDLLKGILVHLPLKPLFCFKLVSKHWNSIISDPKFQFMHRQEHNNRAVGLIHQTCGTTQEVETKVVPFERSSNRPPKIHKTPDTIIISHSCNGLLIFKRTAAPKHYYVYNPTTNQKTTTPLLRDEIEARPRERVVGMYLAFDPSKSPHHKVVCVWENKEIMHQYQFEVYSSKTRSWEIRCGWFTDYVDFYNGIYWNGAIHWLNSNGKSIYFNPDNDEMPHVMPHPPIHEGLDVYYFGESCGHLHCAVYGGEHLSLCGIYVYEMRRDYSEWFLKYRVDGQCLRNCTAQHLSCVVRGKRDEDSFLVLGNVEGEIMRYNLANKTCETILDNGFVPKRASWSRSFQYIESPCSI